MKPFTLWIEFEAGCPHTWQPEHQVCHVQVNLPDGRYCCLTVAALSYLNSNSPDQYLHPRLPDLFVNSLSREQIEAAVTDLLALDNLSSRFQPAPSGAPSFTSTPSSPGAAH
jgi:hypothetical protein